MLYKASAPGSLMLMGEYAVLHGKQALVCAIDKRITVTLEPVATNKIIVKSRLGNFETDIIDCNIQPPFQFVLAAIASIKEHLTQGFKLTIESEFSERIGFASSAAVTVATLSALAAYLNQPLSNIELIKKAKRVVFAVQGLGSGADVAACVTGGIIAYRSNPLLVEALPGMYPLTVLYSGKKVKTVEAVTRVAAYFANHPSIFKRICRTIDSCVEDGIDAVYSRNWEKLGNLMRVNQGLLSALQVNTPALQTLIEILNADSNILGAKISGSGFGDCVIGLGATKNALNEAIPVSMTGLGVKCETLQTSTKHDLAPVTS